MQVGRDVVPDRAMRSDFVVVSAPSVQLFAGVCKAHEPVGVQALRSELAVEGFEEAVVRRLSRPGGVQRDIVGLGPQIQVAGDELAASVDPDRPGISDLSAYPLERLNDILTAIGEPRISRRAVARMRVHHRQNAQLRSQGELVVDEVHRPDLIGTDRIPAVLAKLGFHPPLGMLVAQLQA